MIVISQSHPEARLTLGDAMALASPTAIIIWISIWSISRAKQRVPSDRYQWLQHNSRISMFLLCMRDAYLLTANCVRSSRKSDTERCLAVFTIRLACSVDCVRSKRENAKFETHIHHFHTRIILLLRILLW